MLTRLRWTPPTIFGEWKVDAPNVLKSIGDYLLSLEKKGAIGLTEATINSSTIGATSPSTGAFSSVDIDGGTIDGAAIGGNSPSTGRFSGSFDADAAGSEAAVRTAGSYGGGYASLDGSTRAGWYIQDSGATIKWFAGQGASDKPNAKIIMSASATGLTTTGWINQVATVNASTTANIAKTTTYAVTTTGWYQIVAQITLTTAATTSSTLPGFSIYWTDPDSSVEGVNEPTMIQNTTEITNTVGNKRTAIITVYAKTGTNISHQTGRIVAYASSGATSMQYGLRINVQKIA